MATVEKFSTDDIPYLKTDEEAGAQWRSHGLPGKTLVHEGIQFYCTGCGQKMNEVLRDRKLIMCVQNDCPKNGWRLLRPDLRSCEIMDRPKEKEDGDKR